MEFVPNRQEDIVNENVVFSRYLDTQKLLSFLLDKEILFTRLDLFNDITEGMTNKNIVDYEITSPDNVNPNLPDLEQYKENNRIARIRIEKETIVSQKSQYVSCWFTGIGESIAMWDIYTSSDGVLIKINGLKLFNYIKDIVKDSQENNWLHYSYGFCDYKHFASTYDLVLEKSNHLLNTYKKNHCYEHEKEFRFVAHSKDGFDDESLFVFPLSVKNIINQFEIIFHPKMEGWKKKNIINLLASLNIEIKTKNSEIRLR